MILILAPFNKNLHAAIECYQDCEQRVSHSPYFPAQARELRLAVGIVILTML